MIRKSSVVPQNIYISILLFVAIFSQTRWYEIDEQFYSIFLSSAFSAGFYISFGKRVLPGIIITSLLGSIVVQLLFGNFDVMRILLFTISISILNIGSALLLYGVLNMFHIDIPNNIRDMILFLFAIVITVVFISVLPAFQLSMSLNIPFIKVLHEYVQPISMGMFIFTIGIVMSNHYDDYFTINPMKRLYGLLFVIAFALLTYYVFSRSYASNSFFSIAAILIILFLINSYMFTYRILLFNAWMYINIYNIIIFSSSEEVNHSLLSSINIYLIVLVAFTLFTKVLIFELLKSNEELNETKEKYEDMLYSTLELFKVRETLSTENVQHSEQIMQNIFDISLRIFYNFNYATCVMKGEKYIEVVDVKGHDKELLNMMKLDVYSYRWTHFSPVLSKKVQQKYQEALKDRYHLFKEDVPKVKESVSILIKLGDDAKGAITFDIMEGENKTFSEGDIYNIGAFQSMINSFYEMNELTIKNNNLRDDIVLSLTRALELFDQYTGGHSEDVAFLARELSKELKLPLEDRYQIYWAGIVHDIGKIGISSDIINKKGKLTVAEYKKVQEHPIFGYEILKKSEDLQDIATLVRHHHEWYNGSGYPDGLKQDEIPYGSQILQVADSVSSMATKRSYQEKKSFDSIIEELEMYKETQFHPKIADAMIALIKKGSIQKYFASRQKQ